MSDKLTITASPQAADLLFKAVKKVLSSEQHDEVNDLPFQNPAAKHLMDDMSRAFDIMAENLIKQVEELLASESKAVSEVKAD